VVLKLSNPGTPFPENMAWGPSSRKANECGYECKVVVIVVVCVSEG